MFNFVQKMISAIKSKAASMLDILRGKTESEKSPFACVQSGHFIDNLNEKESLALFKESVRMVEVEVFSFCNRRCWFCPNSHVDRHSKNIRMKENLYYKILQNLKQIDYSGIISYSRYNEPLADHIIFERIRQAKETVPNAILHLNTNGDYLKGDIFQKLYSVGLRSLNIQVYLPENMRYTDEMATKFMLDRLHEYKLPHKFKFSRPVDWLEYSLIYKDIQVRIYTRNFRSNGTHRGGTIRALNRSSVRKSPCLISFHDVYIDFNGKVVPCCNIRSDIPKHAPYILGDLNDNDATLFSIFSSSEAVTWRKGLIGYGGKQSPCDRCSFVEISPTPENLSRVDTLLKRTGMVQ